MITIGQWVEIRPSIINGEVMDNYGHSTGTVVEIDDMNVLVDIGGTLVWFIWRRIK
jgi:alpha-amylase/alpha-mannosidase (GH57 family)